MQACTGVMQAYTGVIRPLNIIQQKKHLGITRNVFKIKIKSTPIF